MYTDTSARLISRIYDAALAPARWMDAMDSIAHHLGGIGVTYGIWNKHNDRAEWLRSSGPLTGLQADYARYYDACDPFRPILRATPQGDWAQMTRAVDPGVLARNELYNDFLIKNGIGDVLGIRLCETPQHVAYFGVHRESDRAPLSADDEVRLKALVEPLTLAARLRLDLHGHTWEPRLARHMLEHIPAPAMVATSDGRVVEMNAAAERILSRADGLEVRNGLLGAQRKHDDAALMRCVRATAVNDGMSGVLRSLLVRRRGGTSSYKLTLAPLAGNTYSDRAALILVADPDEPLHEQSSAREASDAAARQPSTQATRSQTPAAAPAAVERVLTSREHDVLRALKHGLSNSEIAQSMCLSGKTVEFHLTNIMKKLDAPNRTMALVIAIQRGYFQL